MLDVGRRIGFGGGCEGKPDGGLRLGTRGSTNGGAAFRVGSGGRLRFGGGGGWLTRPPAAGRAFTTCGGSLGSVRCSAGGGPDCGRRTGGGGGPERKLRGAPTLASAFSGGPELRFAVMAAFA